MVFNSLQYALFLSAVFVIYWRLRRRGQNILLLATSWFFYATWDWRFLGLLVLSTVTDFIVGGRLASAASDSRRRIIFGISLVVNLGILGFFKYFNFFAESASRLLGSVGLNASGPTLKILLPVGISFYTFHGISYTFDVYRRKIRPARSLVDFALFIAFFPQLIAGPIGRAQWQLPQFEMERQRPSPEQMRAGIHLLFIGLFRKVVIADSLAPFVDGAFNQASGGSWITLLAGVWAFALQIYGDFSGYSDMARGSARLLGIELPENFNQPYLSRNITDFWRTWHVSLSSWLRDYLYIPLGGNRGTAATTARNIMITMLLGGLWHGAAWTFVVWGALHGMFLIAHRPVRDLTPKEPTGPFRRKDILPALGTFHMVCLGWIFFRAESFGQAFD